MAKLKRNAVPVTTIEQSVDMYLSHARNKNLSPITIDTYERHLKWAYLLLEEKPINQLVANDLEQMLEHFQEQHKYSIRSQNNMRRYLNGWLRWCKFEKLIDHEIKLPYKKDTKKLQPVPTDAEMKRLLTKPDINRCTYNHYACWLVVNIIASTGLRIRSISHIKKKDIDFDNNLIFISTMKNRTEQRVVLNRKLKRVLQEFLSTVECDSEYLLVDKYNKRFNEKTLSMNVIRYAREHGIECSAHAIRRWNAVSSIKQGMSIYTLSKQLHHSSVQITQLYLESITTESLKDELREYDPLDNLK